MGYINRTISFEQDIFEKIEELRGTKTQFRSKFVNDCVREKLNLPRRKE